MLGTWRWNIGFGIAGLLLTALFSIGKNPLSVTLFRSMYAFIAFFVLAFAVRFIIALILKPPAMIGEQTQQDESKGSQLDLLTPDESDDLNALLKSQMKEGISSGKEAEIGQDKAEFRPLNPPQLVSAKNNDPEELAKAIRHLTGE